MQESTNIPHIAPEGHPVHTLMEEHQILLDLTANLTKSAGELKEYSNLNEATDLNQQIIGFVDDLKTSQNHYLREENVLFSYLEKHGVTGPTSQMWAEHDQVRATEKEIYRLMEQSFEMDFSTFAGKLEDTARTLNEILATHFYKENNILFPMALRSFTEQEWQETERQFAEIGYCSFTPKSALKSVETDESDAVGGIDAGMIDTGSGKLSLKELISMLNSLPVELTFVDKDDTFRYFNKVKDAVFTRTVASIGNKVQNCHPQKSVHMVNKILADFRSGAKDEVAFWIHLKDKYVFIRYFAVRDSEGKYLGCMEVTQDIKDIQEISGEKRLAD